MRATLCDLYTVSYYMVFSSLRLLSLYGFGVASHAVLRQALVVGLDVVPLHMLCELHMFFCASHNPGFCLMARHLSPIDVRVVMVVIVIFVFGVVVVLFGVVVADMVEFLVSG